jgi:membrane protein YqaA with SNARE-associated domain
VEQSDPVAPVAGTAGPADPAAPVEDESVRERLVEAAIAAELATGRREETTEEARRHVLIRIGRMGAGAALVLLGIAMTVLPGPGLLTVAAGLLLLSRDFPWAARMLDRVRARLSQDADGQTHRGVIVASIVLAALSVVGSVVMLLG